MKDGLEYSLEYIRSGDYFIPNLTLPEETRPNGVGAAYEQHPQPGRGNHPRGAYL